MTNQKLNTPEGWLYNGRLSPTVASNNLTLALKTFAGTNPSTSDVIEVCIGGTMRVITTALSVTAAAGTNWMNAAGAELASKELDLFPEMAWVSSSSAVALGFGRIPYATLYSDYSTLSTAETYGVFSTTPASTDACVNIGRFAATLSSSTAFNWSVPTYTEKNLIQYPIREADWRNWGPQTVGYSVAPTNAVYIYKLKGNEMELFIREETAGTSNAITLTYTLPMSFAAVTNMVYGNQGAGDDNGAYLATPIYGASSVTLGWDKITFYKDLALATWTASGGKRIRSFWIVGRIA